MGIDLALEGAGTARLVVRVGASAQLPREGQAVAVTNPDGLLVFGGTIASVRTTIPADFGSGSGADRFAACACRDYNHTAFRRRVTYLADDAVTSAVASALVSQVNAVDAEGLTASVTTGVLLEGQTFFDNVTLAEALSYLAARTPGFVWNISAAKVVEFKPRTLSAAPFAITTTSAAYDLSVTRDLTTYRNEQYVLGNVLGQGASKTEQLTTVTGQAYARTTLRAAGGPGAKAGGAGTDNVPIVTLDGANKTVGRKGDPADQGSFAYFEKGTRTLTFDAPLSVVDAAKTLAITYFPERRAIGYARDEEGAARYGLHTNLYVDDAIRTDAQAQAVADLLLDRAAPIAVEYLTYRHGLLPGQSQTVTLPTHGIASATAFTVDSVSFEKLEDARFEEALYRVRLVSGRPLSVREDLLRHLIRRDEDASTGDGEKLDRLQAHQDNLAASASAVFALV